MLRTKVKTTIPPFPPFQQKPSLRSKFGEENEGGEGRKKRRKKLHTLGRSWTHGRNPFLPEKSTPFPTKALPPRPSLLCRARLVRVINFVMCLLCARNGGAPEGGEKRQEFFFKVPLDALWRRRRKDFCAPREGRGGGKRPKKEDRCVRVCAYRHTAYVYTHNNFARLSVASAGWPPSRSLWWVLYCECPSQIPPPHHLTQPFPTLPSYLEADEDSKIAACERVFPLFCHLTPPDTKPMFPPYQFPPFSSISLPVPPSLRLCRCCLFCSVCPRSEDVKTQWRREEEPG